MIRDEIWFYDIKDQERKNGSWLSLGRFTEAEITCWLSKK